MPVPVYALYHQPIAAIRAGISTPTTIKALMDFPDKLLLNMFICNLLIKK